MILSPWPGHFGKSWKNTYVHKEMRFHKNMSSYVTKLGIQG